MHKELPQPVSQNRIGFNSRLTRRKFIETSLKMAGVGIAAAAFSACETQPAPLPLPEAYPVSVEVIERRKKLLKEIEDYRKNFGLKGLPSEVSESDTIVNQPDWSMTDSPIQIIGTENQISYGIQAVQVIERVFGENIRRLVPEINFDIEYGMAAGQQSSNRIALSYPNINGFNYDALWPAALIIHEATHGVDPRLRGPEEKNIYPTDTKLKITHGKWRMLKEFFSYEKEKYPFPIHPLAMKPFLEQLGEKFAQNMIEGKVDQLVDINSAHQMNEIYQKQLDEIASDGKGNPGVFNRERCRHFGEELLRKIASAHITLTPANYIDYEKKLDYPVLMEMFADMMEYVVPNYKNIQNKELLEGACEVIAAVRQDDAFSWDDINLKKTDEENQRYVDFYPKNRTTVLAKQPESGFTPSEGETPYFSWIHQSDKVALPPSKYSKEFIEKWANYHYKTITFLNKFKSLHAELDNLDYFDWDFDLPEHHLWETEYILNAIERRWVNDTLIKLLDDQKELPLEELDDISGTLDDKINALDWYFVQLPH